MKSDLTALLNQVTAKASGMPNVKTGSLRPIRMQSIPSCQPYALSESFEILQSHSNSVTQLKMKNFTLLFVLLFTQTLRASSDLIIEGNHFQIPANQQINFVPLKVIDPSLYNDPSIPRVLDLKPIQSKIKSQGQRGSCTYFVMTSLIESLIKMNTGLEIDISEEYMAWAGKEKLNLRANEEDSSVAVNALTTQKLGFMLEADLPYQLSWFEKGYPCEGLKGQPNIDPKCYSHHGPSAEDSNRIIEGSAFVFEAVDSSSLDLVRALARTQSPVTVSILGHHRSFENSTKTGEFVLTPEMKIECQANRKKCSGHAALIVGYDLNKRHFTFKNSWGENWGDNGYGTISFDYMDQMSERKFLTGILREKINFP